MRTRKDHCRPIGLGHVVNAQHGRGQYRREVLQVRQIAVSPEPAAHPLRLDDALVVVEAEFGAGENRLEHVQEGFVADQVGEHLSLLPFK